jgi:hypothetical protein
MMSFSPYKGQKIDYDETKTVSDIQNIDLNEEWQVLQEIEDVTKNTFSDTSGRVEQIYEYTIQVTDDVGLRSDYAFPVKGRRYFDNSDFGVTDFVGRFNPTTKSINLSWTFDPPQDELLRNVDYYFYLYRAENNDELKRYRILPSSQTSFTETISNADINYSYAIVVGYLNGKAGAISNPVMVETGIK